MPASAAARPRPLVASRKRQAPAKHAFEIAGIVERPAKAVAEGERFTPRPAVRFAIDDDRKRRKVGQRAVAEGNIDTLTANLEHNPNGLNRK
jgi:hypothetical protein